MGTHKTAKISEIKLVGHLLRVDVRLSWLPQNSRMSAEVSNVTQPVLGSVITSVLFTILLERYILGCNPIT